MNLQLKIALCLGLVLVFLASELEARRHKSGHREVRRRYSQDSDEERSYKRHHHGSKARRHQLKEGRYINPSGWYGPGEPGYNLPPCSSNPDFYYYYPNLCHNDNDRDQSSQETGSTTTVRPPVTFKPYTGPVDYWGRPIIVYEPQPYYVYDYWGVPHLVDPRKQNKQHKKGDSSNGGGSGSTDNSDTKGSNKNGTATYTSTPAK